MGRVELGWHQDRYALKLRKQTVNDDKRIADVHDAMELRDTDGRLSRFHRRWGAAEKAGQAHGRVAAIVLMSLVILGTLLASAWPVAAEAQWSSLPRLTQGMSSSSEEGGAGEGAGLAFSNDGNAYTLFGGGTRTFRRYSPDTQSWETLAPAPVSIGPGGGLVAVGDDHFYALAGAGQGQTFLRYRSSTGTWETRAQTPGPIGNGAAIAWGGGDFIYVLQGDGQHGFWRYSIAANSWSALTSTPEPVKEGGALAVVGGQVYAFLGSSGDPALWRYDLASRTWVIVALMEEEIGGGAGLTWPGDDYLFMILGGDDGDFLAYKLSENIFIHLEDVPDGIDKGGAMTHFGSRIYVIGGGDLPDGIWSYRIQSAEVERGRWVTRTSMALDPINDKGVGDGGGLAGADGLVYAMWGGDSQVFRRYSVETRTWTPRAAVPVPVKEGGALVYGGAGNYYAFTGNGSPTFYRYSSATNSWTSRAAAPSGTKAGAALAWDGGDFIYAFKGEGQSSFWRYSISGNRWSSLAAAPGEVKEGAAMAFAEGNLYAFTGGGSPTLWRFQVTNGRWQRVFDLPQSRSPSMGASLAYVGSDILFATLGGDEAIAYSLSRDLYVDLPRLIEEIEKGGAIAYSGAGSDLFAIGAGTSFWSYRFDASGDGPIDLGSWAEMPSVNVGTFLEDGVAEGGALAGAEGYLYGIVGAGTRGFVRYSPSLRRWQQRAPIPVDVDKGGALAYGGDGTLYAFFGNGQTAFWAYSMATNSWSARAPLPVGAGEGAALAWDGMDAIYAFSGGAGSGFWRYAISENAWVLAGSAPRPVDAGGSMVFANGDLYAFTGGGAEDLWRFRPSTSTWASVGFIQEGDNQNGVQEGGALVYPGGDYIYAFSGGGDPFFWGYSLSERLFDRLPDMIDELEKGVALAYPGNGNRIYAWGGGNDGLGVFSYLYGEDVAPTDPGFDDGEVGGEPDPFMSEVDLSTNVLRADGLDQASITIRLRNASGNAVDPGVYPIFVFMEVENGSGGTLSPLLSQGDGIYRATLTSSTVPGTEVALSFHLGTSEEDPLIGDSNGQGEFEVVFVARPWASAELSALEVPATAPADGLSQVPITVTLRDTEGNLIIEPDEDWSLFVTTDFGDLDPLTLLNRGLMDENGDGTYTAFVSSGEVGVATIRVFLGLSPSAPLIGTASLEFRDDVQWPNPFSSEVLVSNGILPVGQAATVTVILRDGAGEPLREPFQVYPELLGSSAVTLSPLTWQGNGVLTGSLTATSRGTAEIKFFLREDRDEESEILQDAEVEFVTGLSWPSAMQSTLTITETTAPANGGAQVPVFVTLRDAAGALITQRAEYEVFIEVEGGDLDVITVANLGLMDEMEELGPGVYVAYVSSTEIGTVRVRTYLGLNRTGALIGEGTIEFVDGPAWPDRFLSEVFVSTDEVPVNSGIEVVVTIVLRDASGERISEGGHSLSLYRLVNEREPAELLVLTDDGDGSYSVRLPTEGASVGDEWEFEAFLGTLRNGDFEILGGPGAEVAFVSSEGGFPDLALSTLEVSSPKGPTDGLTPVVVTVTLRNADGSLFEPTGSYEPNVYITTDFGDFDLKTTEKSADTRSGMMQDGSLEGTFVASLTASQSGTATVRAYLGLFSTAPRIGEAQVVFEEGVQLPDPWLSELFISTDQLPANASAEVEVTVVLRDGAGVPLTQGGFSVSLFKEVNGQEPGEPVNTLIDNGDGTYTARVSTAGEALGTVWEFAAYLGAIPDGNFEIKGGPGAELEFVEMPIPEDPASEDPASEDSEHEEQPRDHDEEGNEEVTEQDIETVIQSFLSSAGSIQPDADSSTDMNGDGKVDVLDVMFLINQARVP